MILPVITYGRTEWYIEKGIAFSFFSSLKQTLFWFTQEHLLLLYSVMIDWHMGYVHLLRGRELIMKATQMLQ